MLASLNSLSKIEIVHMSPTILAAKTAIIIGIAKLKAFEHSSIKTTTEYESLVVDAIIAAAPIISGKVVYSVASIPNKLDLIFS